MAETTRPLTSVPATAARAAPSLLAGVAGVGIVLGLAWDAGGYFPSAHLTAGAVAYAVLAIAIVVRPPDWALSTPALVALVALVGLALWTGASASWSSSPDTAIEDMQRNLLYVALLGLGLIAGGSGRYARHLPWALLAVVAVVCGAGLVSRLAPDLIDAAGSVSAFDDYRLGYPLSYWNAFGTLGAMGMLLGTGLAADPRAAPVARALAAAAVVPVGVAAYLSFSRGAWLALAVGMVALLLLAPYRLHLLFSLLAVAAALAVALLRLRGHPALTDDPAAGAGQLAEGDDYAPTVVALTVAVAVAQFAWARVRLRPEGRAALRFVSSRVGIVAVVALLIAGGAVYAFASAEVEGRAANRLVATEGWIDRQWDDFMDPAQFSASGAERLTSARGTRSDLYRVAIDGFEDRPLIGDGAGGFEVRFAHDRDVQEKVRDAHSLYLETIGELGLVGGLLLLAFVAAVVWAAVLARRRAGGLSRAQAAAVSSAVIAFLAHAMVDWDWQVPALTGTALLLAASLFPVGRSSRRVRRRRSGAIS